MSRRKSSSKETYDKQELTGSHKTVPAAMSNSFNPPLPYQSKPPLSPITKSRNTQSNRPVSGNVSNNPSSTSLPITDETNLVLPAKVFKAKKTSVNDLSQAACTHLWFRRIKEIFLVMGKQNDPFTRFDMDLARTDMIQTCEQYLESERPKISSNRLVCISYILSKICFLLFRMQPNKKS